jgi:hypothetical protein
MNLILIPSALALAIKLWLIASAGKNLILDHRDILYFMLALLGLNTIELVGLTNHLAQTGNEYLFLQTYYAFAFLAAGSFLVLAINLYTSTYRWLKNTVYAVALILALGSYYPNFILNGVEDNGYFLFQIFVVLSLTTGIALLAYHSKYAKQALARSQSLLLMLGLAPFAMATLIVIALMSSGSIYNGAGLISLTVSFFLAFLIWSEERTKTFRLFSYTPFTKEHKLRKRFNILFDKAVVQSGGKLDFRAQRQVFENLLIDFALQANGHNVTDTARKLGISPVTIYRKLNGESPADKA